MKFTLELPTFVKMLKTVGKKMPGQKRSDGELRLSACSARVFVESNQTVAGIEALVLEDGQCRLPRATFLKVLETYHGRKHLTVEADARGLRIGNFSMAVSGYLPQAVAPGVFQVFPVTDLTALFPDQAPPPPEPPPQPTAPLAYPVAEEGCFPVDSEPEALPTPDEVSRMTLAQLPPETLDALFGIWVKNPHKPWLDKVWGWLGEEGLTRYRDARDYHHVLGRLAVLAEIYHEWNRIAYEEGDSVRYSYPYWFEALPFVITGLRKEFPERLPPQQVSLKIEEEQMAEILHDLIEPEVSKVFGALMRHYECEFDLGHDLRHASGKGDQFDFANERFAEWKTGKEFFDEHGVTLAEFDAVGWLMDRPKP